MKMMMITTTMNDKSILLVLLHLLVVINCSFFCDADQFHPFCQTHCLKTRQILNNEDDKLNCYFQCNEIINSLLLHQQQHRTGSRRPSSSSYDAVNLIPSADDWSFNPSPLGVGVGGEGDGPGFLYEIPNQDHLRREARDRSAFVRIGKRDVSAVSNSPSSSSVEGGGYRNKRRDEFIRIGRGGGKGGKQQFLFGRSNDDHLTHSHHRVAKSQTKYEELLPGEEIQQQSADVEEAEEEKTRRPEDDEVKRPSAFVRIGKNENSKQEPTKIYYLPEATENNARNDVDDEAAKVFYPVVEEGEKIAKKASAFVRIGKKGAAFVRIGKSN